MRSMRSMHGGFIFRNWEPSLKVHPNQRTHTHNTRMALTQVVVEREIVENLEALCLFPKTRREEPMRSM
jgi:hypothetical protein